MAFSLNDVFRNMRRVASNWPVDFRPDSLCFGVHRSLKFGDGDDFGRISVFDPLIHNPRKINWLSSNPFDEDELSVRENIEDREATFVIACDLSSSMMFSVGDNQHKERMLLEVYGDCALTCFRAQDPCVAIGFSNSILFYDSQPRKTEEAAYYNVAKMYEFFSDIRSGGSKLKRSETDYLTLFDFVRRQFGNRKISLIVISDFIGMERHSPEQIRNILGDHDISFIYLDDPDEFKVRGESGYVWHENIETGEQIEIRAEYLPVIEAKTRLARKEYRALCEAHGIHSMVLEYGSNKELRKYVERLVRFVYIRGASK